MADENVTASENTTETNEQAATPATQASKPAVPSPAAMKPHAPSPAAFAKKAPQRPATSTGFSEADIKAAEAFGRVADDGTVFVKEGEGEREVGQFPDASKEEALALYARRYLDLKAKLDLFANRLKSSNVKNREIDESIKTLSAEIEQPAVVGDIEALKSQFEALKEAGAAKKAELSEAHKAAVAKALAERTAIVEKAEALANSLGDNTNWRSTADKFRSLFQQWQDHQHNSVRLDKADADALWSRFSSARTTFNSARRKWAQGRDEERSNAKAAKEAIIAEAEEIKDSTAWVETSRKFNELMDRWKKAGRAGRRDDDALWARFRAAADTFFNARQADREQISSSEKENLAKKEELSLQVVGENPIEALGGLLAKMAGTTPAERVEKKSDDASAFIVGTTEFAVPLGHLIDVSAEIEKAEADLKHLEGFLAGVKKKLSNERFVANAPEAVVALERKKQSDSEEKIASLKESIAALKNK